MVSTLKIYEILEEAEIEDRKARAITMAIERAIDANNTELAKTLASKEDIARLEVKIAEMKAEMIRWMFIFWLGQIPILAGLIKFIK